MGGDITDVYAARGEKTDGIGQEKSVEKDGKSDNINERNAVGNDGKTDKLNAEIRGIRVKKSALKGVEIDAKNIPDIIPVISVAAGAAVGRTVIYNAARLRIKECDRLEATAEMLTRLGAKAAVEGDTLIIEGNGGFLGEKPNGGDTRTDGGFEGAEAQTNDRKRGGLEQKEIWENEKKRGGDSDNKIVLDGHNDHRMVMSSAVAAFACGVPVEIVGIEAVDKSYPNFFEDLEKLTGQNAV
jgi:3-phosphoshikimate 1-carboxyvinyltransferase